MPQRGDLTVGLGVKGHEVLEPGPFGRDKLGSVSILNRGS